MRSKSSRLTLTLFDIESRATRDSRQALYQRGLVAMGNGRAAEPPGSEHVLPVQCHVGGAHYFSGDYEAAERWGRKTAQRRRQYYFGHVFLVGALVRLDRLSDARSAAREFLQLFPDFKTADLRLIAFRPVDFARLSADLRAAGVPD